MIPDQQNEGTLVQVFALQESCQPPHLLIHIGNFTVVGIRAVHRLEGLRRVVGVVGVKEMNPGEKRTAGLSSNPPNRMVDHLTGTPFHGVEIDKPRG